MNRTSPMRRHTRFPVRWPVLYRGDEFLAEGTVVDLTHIGWRIAGTMLVEPGMRLSLELAVPERLEPVRVERAIVLWVNGCEFAIEVDQMADDDQVWVNEFLRQKLGLPWISSKAGLPSAETNRDQCSPSERAHVDACGSENIPWSWISMQPLAKGIEEQVIQRCMTDSGCSELDARAAYDRFMREVWQPALRIVEGMLAKQASRRLGRDSISDN